MRNSLVAFQKIQALPTACAYPASADSSRGELIRRLGSASVAVLFRGQPGSGRRWLARTLHSVAVPRGPLVELHLDPAAGGSATPGTQVDRIRAAVRDAAGGDLLVPDVAALSPCGQSALAETIERWGSRVRVLGCVCSVSGKKLQPGLGRRLVDSFLHVELPPLPERWPELPEIVRLFLRCRAEVSGARLPPVADALIEQMAAARWPRTLADIEYFAARALASGSGRIAARSAIGRLGRTATAAEALAPGQPLRSVGGEAGADIVNFRLGKSFSHPGGSALPNQPIELQRWPRELVADPDSVS